MNSKEMLYRNLDETNGHVRKDTIGVDTRPPPSLFYMGERREPMIQSTEDAQKIGEEVRDPRFNPHLQLIGENKSARENAVPFSHNSAENTGAVDLKLRTKETVQPQSDDTKPQVV